MNFYEIDKNLKAEFASKKLTAEQKAEENLAKASSLLSYTKLTALMKELIIEISKSKKPSKEKIEELEDVRKQRRFILTSLGMSEDDLKPKYECKTCSDTGFVGSKMCNCFVKRRNEEILKACGLGLQNTHGFDDYSTSICKDKTQAKQLLKQKDFLSSWTKHFPAVSKKTIVLAGTTGVGKTYLAECVANEMFAHRHSVCFVSAFDFNAMLGNFHTTFSSEKNSWIAPLIDSDLLVIDDLGSEPLIKNVTVNYLYLVLSERIRFGKATLITTNLSSSDIMDRYGERVFSRLFDKQNGVAFNLTGTDLRCG